MVKESEARGLEGKFDADMGDLVRLKGIKDNIGRWEDTEVSGYVILKSSDKVTLSHENPNKAFIKTFSGNRKYKLADFNSYDILA